MPGTVKDDSSLQDPIELPEEVNLPDLGYGDFGRTNASPTLPLTHNSVLSSCSTSPGPPWALEGRVPGLRARAW